MVVCDTEHLFVFIIYQKSTGAVVFVVQSLSCVRLFVTPWTAAHQASLTFTSTLRLLRFMSVESVMPSNHLIFCHSLSSCPQSFTASGLPMSWLFASSSQSIGASASASVLPMDIEGWFPLGLTALISLQSKRRSRIFSSTTVQSISSSALSLLYGPTLRYVDDYWEKNHNSDCTDQLSIKIPTVQFK